MLTIRKFRTALAVAASFVLLLTIGAPIASADVIEVNLTSAPGTATLTLNANGTITVTLNLTGGYTITGGGTVVALNVVGSTTGLSVSTPAGYSGSCCSVTNVDGVGDFELLIDRDPSVVKAGETTLTFTVSRTGGFTSASELYDNSGGDFVAVHVLPPAGESFYTGGQIPEPGTLALLGTGLLAVGGALRRRLNM